MGVFYLKMAT